MPLQAPPFSIIKQVCPGLSTSPGLSAGRQRRTDTHYTGRKSCSMCAPPAAADPHSGEQSPSPHPNDFKVTADPQLLYPQMACPVPAE
ncbi:hypothetical protein NQZ68_024716 [Dissostichus eleginoides]|nr:hypothetical protein NQZ68_024716 [Dissostichus eleginoides]